MLENTDRVIKAKPTIKDVAEDSGVSIATVSAVVHGAEWLTEKTRERVQRSIDELGYRPNHVARSLKTRTSNTIGVVVADVTNAFYLEVFRRLGQILRERDRSLILCDCEADYAVGATNMRMLLEKQVDAVVLLGDAVDTSQILSAAQQKPPLPIIAVGHELAIPGVHTLLMDGEGAAFEAVRHLAHQRRRRVALIHQPVKGGGSSNTVAGYLRGVEWAGSEPDSSLIVESNGCYDGGRNAMRQLLSLPTPPDAVFADSDLTALGAMHVAVQSGYKVPEDIAFIGTGDSPLAAHAYPALSSMAVPTHALGEAAADLILQPTPSSAERPSRRLFPASLVVRASSAPY